MRILIVFLSFIFLSGCVSTQLDASPEKVIHIIDVEVTIAPDVVTTSSFSERFRNVLMHYATAYNAENRGRVEGYILKINVTGLHYKNPLLSLLVGDANSLSTESFVIDPENGNVLRQYKSNHVDGASAILNGISGAVLSASIGKEAPEKTLMLGIAKPIMIKAYAGKLLRPNTSERLKREDLQTPTVQPISPLSQQIVDEGQPNSDLSPSLDTTPIQN